MERFDAEIGQRHQKRTFAPVEGLRTVGISAPC